MKRKSMFKGIVAASILSAMVISAATSASAATLEFAPVKSAEESPYTETYQAYLDGKVTVSANSGVKLAPYAVSSSTLNPRGVLPSSYKTETTPIRDQGMYNSCWTFSSLGALEGLLSKEGKGNYDLSEAHLGWWTTPDYNRAGNGWTYNGFDNGGYGFAAGGYLMSWQGAKAEKDIPYTPYNVMTLPGNMDTASNVVNVTGAIYVENDVTSIKTAIYNYGAIDGSFNAAQAGFNYDYSSYYQGWETTNFEGHGVTIIGWDDNYSKSNFRNTPPGNGAWLAKNSWGTSVGDDGYLWISYYDRYVFDTETWGANLVYTSARTATQYDRIYQNEIYGATYESIGLGYSNGDSVSKITFANVFDFDSAHPYLQKIIFESQLQGVSYSAYYVPVVNGAPTTNESSWTYLNGGVVDNAGYVTVDTTGTTIPSGKGAIAITVDTKSSDVPAMIGVAEWLPNYDYTDFMFYQPAQRNQCYMIINGESYDLMDIYDQFAGDPYGGTFVIKAVTTSQIIGDLNGDFRSDSSDALLVLRQSVGLESFNNSQMINADVNFDGVVDAFDAVTIRRQALGLISEY